MALINKQPYITPEMIDKWNNAPTSMATLWSGSKTTGGTITLNDSVANYDIIYFACNNGGERTTHTMVKPSANQNLTFMSSTPSGVGTMTEPYSYKTVFYLSIDSTGKKITIGTGYNNSNQVYGIYAVYGVKYPMVS